MPTSRKKLNIVIMAGGGGTRLWPLSLQDKPKQFLDLGTGKTLLEDAWERAVALTDKKNIYVATTLEYEKEVKKLLPKVRKANMMYEPQRRDTGPAFAAAAAMLEQQGEGDVPTIFMWSDHIFTNEKNLLRDLKMVPKLLNEYPNSVVIVGHNPISAETGLGYIEVGNRVLKKDNVHHVKSFKEKPDKETAEKYITSGKHFWNMAYVSVRPSYLLEELEEYVPDTMKQIGLCREALSKSNHDAYAKAYAKCEPISIDYALLEKTPRILAVTGDYGWSDVGNWAAVKDVFGKKGDFDGDGYHIHIDSEGNYVYNATGKAISLIGVQDTIVVVTDKAVLVVNKDEAHKVKETVERLKKDEKKQYL